MSYAPGLGCLECASAMVFFRSGVREAGGGIRSPTTSYRVARNSLLNFSQTFWTCCLAIAMKPVNCLARMSFLRILSGPRWWHLFRFWAVLGRRLYHFFCTFLAFRQFVLSATCWSWPALMAFLISSWPALNLLNCSKIAYSDGSIFCPTSGISCNKYRYDV